MPKPKELSPQELRRPCPLDLFDFESTADASPLSEIIGQDRATGALEFGIEIASDGYNVFAMGPVGAGKATVVREFLERKAPTEPVPEDWCYVNLFEDPYRPKAIGLPAGRGCALRDDMQRLIDELLGEIPRAFEGDYYQQRQKEVLAELQEKQASAFEDLEHYLNERGFTPIRTPSGLAIAPMMDGKPLSNEEYEALDTETKKRYEVHRADLQEKMASTMQQIREQEKSARERVGQLDQELARFVVSGRLKELREKYVDCEGVLEYLEQLEGDILQNVAYFRKESAQPEAAAIPIPTQLPDGGSPLERYEVNLLVDHCRTQGAPVVVEANPTYHNLFGRIEYRAEFGALLTHFTMIKAGALHRANGGYLVVDAKRLLTNPLSWDALKRALQSKQLKIEQMGEAFRTIATVSLEPEPIPLDLKVILIGDPEVYYALHALDDDFIELFKVKADFETRMPRSKENVARYAKFIGDRCRQENLLHFDRSGVAKVVEYGSRMVEDQERLTTRFADVADIIREASYWASRDSKKLVSGDDVIRAIDQRTYRSSRIQERIIESAERGFLFVDTAGEVIGQVNGLSIVSDGDHVFGKPSRITATTYRGKAGVTNIDREVKMTGPIHDKGVLILTGYLGAKYAQNRALSLSASVVFEQAYEGVEGDSASSTELYALLSSLAEVPIRQGIAVTGSVNQRGEIQAVGGVTRKIEGFFDVCKMRGLTGDQGVMIPAANVPNLMLREDVVTAVEHGQFHIYPVHTVDEGISILTGSEAGQIGEDGTYPEGTINYLALRTLQEFAEEEKASVHPEEDAVESSSSE